MKRLHLYNTLSRNVEPVEPMDGEALRFYCCGPTVYGPAHIGNFRTFVVQDVFRRVVEATGVKTNHVRNVTDVDDKTIRDAQAAGKTLVEFTSYWRERFDADCEALDVLEPHVVPSAIEHIPEQIDMITTLVEKGLAYQGENGSVYYRIHAFETYGKLAGLDMDGLRQNADARLNTSDEYEKESASDFALWKAWRPEDGENGWDSPWGRGRPGWHIECSAMIRKYLGDSFDLHSGGIDLVFPHHENEIAQSEGASGKPFARLWFHIAHLRVDGKKMSKSLGNLYTLDDIRSWGLEANDLRYLLISGHYRQPLNFTKEGLTACHAARKKLRHFSASLPETDVLLEGFGEFEPVLDALCDELNTPKALGRLHKIVGETAPRIKSGDLTGDALSSFATAFRKILTVFGIDASPEEALAIDVPAEIRTLANARWAARSSKDWAEADRLRDALKGAGWQMQDGSEAYELNPL